MDQQECKDVKAMLEELGTLVPKIEALKESIDSGEGIDVIKKTKEELQSVLHKHSMLRYNLKEWERRSKKIQRIDKIAEKLKKEGNDADLSVDELHALYKQEMRGFDSSSPFAFSYEAHSETKDEKQGGRREREREVLRITWLSKEAERAGKRGLRPRDPKYGRTQKEYGWLH